jgi:PAS domain S-box-containing protein
MTARKPLERESAQLRAMVAETEGPAAGLQLLDELHASETRYRRLFEAAKDGILILDARTGVIEAVNPFLADSRKVIQCNIRDITARARVEKQLHVQSAALNAAANAIVITDRAGNVDWVNPAFSDLTGYTAIEAIGKNTRDLLKSGRHDHVFYEALWKTVLSGQTWRGEIVNRRKDGSLYTEEQSITPVRDAHGEIRQFILHKPFTSEPLGRKVREVLDA